MEYNIFLIKNQIMRGKYEHFLVKSVFHGDFPDFFRRKKLLYKIVYILNSRKFKSSLLILVIIFHPE